MAPQGARWQRRIQAAESAVRLLDELDVDTTQQIDVFRICEDLGLWLTFLPMDNLLGAFVPEGVGGVLVTTQRPIPIQRYTAAHEIGHWRLDHGRGLALDGEEHVLGNSPVEREQLAQVFAGSLLMPPPLVFSVLDRLGVAGQPLDPEHAYALAREAGVSYEAAVRQLAHLRIIGTDQIEVLRQKRPLQVKAGLALGRRPVHGYADVWPVNEDWDDQLLALRVEDEVVISLPENRTTGYRWMLEDEPQVIEPLDPPPIGGRTPLELGKIDELRAALAQRSDQPLARAPRAVLDRLRNSGQTSGKSLPASGGVDVVGDEYIPARSPWLDGRQARRQRIGGHQSNAMPPGSSAAREDQDPRVAGTGRRVLSMRFPQPGPATIRLRYQNPYADEGPIEQYALHAIVEARRSGFSIDQLAASPDEPWTAEARQRSLDPTLEPLPDDEPGVGSTADEPS